MPFTEAFYIKGWLGFEFLTILSNIQMGVCITDYFVRYSSDDLPTGYLPYE